MRRMRLPCCACAPIDQPALAPIAARKSRRPMRDPPRWFSGAYRGQRCVGTGSSGRFVLPCVGPFFACAVLPAGAFAGEDLHPLDTAALSTPTAILPPRTVARFIAL